ncbi:hypothetical protein Thermo_00649 [Thermoplasmatales archaeon]|nr:hypothetical protein Thermo_00649 [Thermoplasmatales archaeon]
MPFQRAERTVEVVGVILVCTLLAYMLLFSFVFMTSMFNGNYILPTFLGTMISGMPIFIGLGVSGAVVLASSIYASRASHIS